MLVFGIGEKQRLYSLPWSTGHVGCCHHPCLSPFSCKRQHTMAAPPASAFAQVPHPSVPLLLAHPLQPMLMPLLAEMPTGPKGVTVSEKAVHVVLFGECVRCST